MGPLREHREFVEKAEKGEIKFYRNKGEIIRWKLRKGGNSASSWHLKGETTCTMSIAATPGGELKTKLSKALEDVRAPDGGKTKVVERGGRPVFAGIEKRDPFQVGGCSYKEGCFVKEGTSCSQVNTCYEIACLTCERIMRRDQHRHQQDPQQDG